jgi:hypothetical protein
LRTLKTPAFLLLVFVGFQQELAQCESHVDRKPRVMRRWVVFAGVPVAGLVSQFEQPADLALQPLMAFR